MAVAEAEADTQEIERTPTGDPLSVALTVCRDRSHDGPCTRDLERIFGLHSTDCGVIERSRRKEPNGTRRWRSAEGRSVL
jgi:hypothetical protein